MAAHRGRKYWSGVIHRFQGGNLSQAQFCAHHKLNMGTFRAWLYRFRAEGMPVERTPKFVEVTATNITSEKCLLRIGEIEIEFGSPPSAVYLSELLTGLRPAAL